MPSASVALAIARPVSAAEIGHGVSLQVGPYRVRMRTPLPEVAASIATLYRDYQRVPDEDFVDFDVAVRRPDGLRRWWRPQVVFDHGGELPFNALPGDQGLPLLEWGLNWCVYSLSHAHLTLHAAVLERGGRALILPAPSGSGKSTLCAGLAFGGWRLLSDELALICPTERNLIPNPRPISLKNESIPVVREFAPDAEIGSLVRETLKGVVAHVRAPASAVTASRSRAEPGWIVLPRYRPGATACLTPLPRARALLQLVENAFNYDVFGAEGFELLASMVGRSRCFELEYGRLPEAVDLLSRLAAEDDGASG
jgi:hypothetical protein